MSASTDTLVGEPASEPDQRSRNGMATVSLIAGIAGFTLVTIIPALACGLLGLRRASQAGQAGPVGQASQAGTAGRRRPGGGQVRCWAGIGLAVMWAAAGVYLAPRVARAADPGCAAYKDTALAAYDQVIADFGGQPGSAASGGSENSSRLSHDLSRAITALSMAAARSQSTVTSQDLSQLAGQLRAVLTEIQDGTVVPAGALSQLNRDAALADTACGTLRL
jgi:hypothetical protein